MVSQALVRRQEPARAGLLPVPMGHGIVVQGVTLAGAEQTLPTLLQMHNEDFPRKFLSDLASIPPPDLLPATLIPAMPASNVTILPQPDSSDPLTLYQPVHRLLNVAMLQLTCSSIGYPRLDPTRIDSAGLVIRRIVRIKGEDRLDLPPSAWLRDAGGQQQWAVPKKLQDYLDPDPTRRPQLQSGQPALDSLLAVQTLAAASIESYTPAFVAAPAVCAAAQRTFVYGVVPTASSDATTIPPSQPIYDALSLESLKKSLPTLLRAGTHSAPMQDETVDY